MQVMQTGDFEIVCNFNHTPDARENNIFGKRIPVMGMYWVSEIHVLIISIDQKGASLGYIYNVNDKILTAKSEFTEIVSFDEWDSPNVQVCETQGRITNLALINVEKQV